MRTTADTRAAAEMRAAATMAPASATVTAAAATTMSTAAGLRKARSGGHAKHQADCADGRRNFQLGNLSHGNFLASVTANASSPGPFQRLRDCDAAMQRACGSAHRLRRSQTLAALLRMCARAALFASTRRQ
jgi:hypothetical protein